MKQKLGTVYTITPGKLITVRLGNIRKPPKLGLKVYGKQEKTSIGRLIDIIGPVESPLAVVKLEVGAQVSIGEPMYIEPPRKHWKPRQNREKRKNLQKHKNFARRSTKRRNH
ncbi:MAG: hypothetical protein F7B59_06490 [Desulfurococcales archaeon]|nr:hypothetical protein [Desulfurococcales archaeon]